MSRPDQPYMQRIKNRTNTMKRTTVSLVLVGLALALALSNSEAQPTPNPPGQISYQGFLTDANGLPLATNTPINYNVTFRIFNASTSGSLLWAEQQVVTVDRGYFTVMLGNGTAISPYGHDLTTVFSGSDASDRYLEMTVQGLALGDPPIAPRLRLLASPYAFLASKALNVDGSAVTTGTVADGHLSPNVALRAGGNTFSGSQRFTAGDLFMDNKHAIWAKNTAGTDEVFFWPRYSDNVTYLNYGSGGFNIRSDAGPTTMFMDNSGNVGIGTSSPGFPLTFAQTTGDKLSLYNSGGGNYYGFGIASFQLQIHTDTSAADVVFGYGQSSNFGETMRIKGNGSVGIGTANPADKLDVNGGISMNGNLTMANGQWIQAKNSTGGTEVFLWPRWSDNMTYLNYGSAGFNIRNNSSTTTMFMQPGGNVGIGTSNPNNTLQIGNNFAGAVGYALAASSPNYGAYIEVNTTSGLGLLVEDVKNGGTSPMIAVVNSGNLYTFQVLANGNCNATAFNQWSDRNAKENFQAVSPQKVLEKVTSLPIQEWNFKTDTEARHIGPMAQDFYAAFGLGSDEKHIATMDADGVALAAIQGLNQKLEQKEAEFSELKSRLEKLEQLLNRKSSAEDR